LLTKKYLKEIKVRRYLIHSVSLHIFFLLFVFWYGSFVSKPVVLTKPSISISLVKKSKPVKVIDTPKVIEQIKPEPEPVPEKIVEPKVVPKAIPKDKIKKPVIEKPVEKVVEKIEKPEDVKEETVTKQEVLPEYGASIDSPEESGLASGQLAVYLGLIESRISRNWNPKQLGFRNSKAHSCTVHFFIARDGTINRESMVLQSGIPFFDREALQAIKSVRKFPPMPDDFSGRELGVTFVFTMRSSI
jgi:TonB family protein